MTIIEYRGKINIIAGIIVWIIGESLNHLLFSYIFMSLDPRYWGWFGRIIFLLISLMFLIAVINTVLNMNKKLNDLDA